MKTNKNIKDSNERFREEIQKVFTEYYRNLLSENLKRALAKRHKS